jgi:Na+/H+ antiporter NhaD/arsenite permease-like protein
VLLLVYVLIAFEVMHRTLAALLGGAILLFVTYTAGSFSPAYEILTFESAMKAIDMNVIFLLMAMMIIVGVLKKTGVFQWIAYKAFQLARGNVFALCGALMSLTAVISAFLDNVTTMLLVFPVTLEICRTLGVHPVTVLVPCAFASNVGGTATLIGDPPNIMIGSYAKLTFMDFVSNLTIICLIGMVVTVAYFLVYYRKEYAKARVADVPQMIARLRAEYGITDGRLLIQGGVVLAITIFLFIIHGSLHMEPSIAALVGASLLLAWSRVNIVEMLEKEIEWPTLIFFMMLFVVVAGAEETGLIQMIADWVRDVSGGSLVVAIVMILWVSAILSAIIDNIPFTATMLPIVAYLTGVIPGAEGGILWWALSLGACLGGNGTMIGASANVVTVGMLEKSGNPVSFMAYVRIAAVPTVITVFLSMLWLLVVEM